MLGGELRGAKQREVPLSLAEFTLSGAEGLLGMTAKGKNETRSDAAPRSLHAHGPGIPLMLRGRDHGRPYDTSISSSIPAPPLAVAVERRLTGEEGQISMIFRSTDPFRRAKRVCNLANAEFRKPENDRN